MKWNATRKEKSIGLYLAVCVLLLFGSPADNSMTAFLGYYGFVIANLCNATRLANAFDKKRKDNGNTIAANRNGISERSD